MAATVLAADERVLHLHGMNPRRTTGALALG
jgi:hypothetical protein